LKSLRPTPLEAEKFDLEDPEVIKLSTEAANPIDNAGVGGSDSKQTPTPTAAIAEHLGCGARDEQLARFIDKPVMEWTPRSPRRTNCCKRGKAASGKKRIIGAPRLFAIDEPPILIDQIAC